MLPTFNCRLAVCVREPEVPVKVTAALVLGALDAALNVTCCSVPGVRLTVADATVTPAGSPEIWTATCDAKPFKAFAVKLTEAELPGLSDALVEFRLRVKSGVGGGPDCEPPPPQPAVHNKANRRRLRHEQAEGDVEWSLVWFMRAENPAQRLHRRITDKNGEPVSSIFSPSSMYRITIVRKRI